MRHILVTNDFPPKVGGIQSYLWELWRRLPPDDVMVLTAAREGAEQWDAQQKFRIVRSRSPVLLPNPLLVRKVRRLVQSFGAEAVVIDPALPLGLLGPHLGVPYALVLHGAEVSVPGRLPVSRQVLSRVLLAASLWVAAGSYPESEAKRAVQGHWYEPGPRSTRADQGTSAGTASPQRRHEGGGALPLRWTWRRRLATESKGGAATFPPTAQIPPGVDPQRFTPMPQIERLATRARFGLPASGPLAVSVSRLVPRKGIDTLIDAVARASGEVPGLCLVIAGDGRERARLERMAANSSVPVKLLGQLTDAELPDFYACADIFALCPRSRWAGLEQEGFGIVLVEAASCAVPCVTVDSGGAAEAVVDGETGLVVRPAATGLSWANSVLPSRRRAQQAQSVAAALVDVLSNPVLATRMGEAGRRRAERQLSYDVLALRLAEALEQLGGRRQQRRGT